MISVHIYKPVSCKLLCLYVLIFFVDSMKGECQAAKDGESADCPIENMSVTGEHDCTALAVVLYDENNVLPMHRQERQFTIADKEIQIKQDWTGLGVAAVVWDAAEVLCRYLETHGDDVKDKSVIELGAGTGLVGIVAALLGGKVTITDRQEVLDFLNTTVESNLSEQLMKNTKVLPLDWTKDQDGIDESYDVILGADIVYIEEVFEDLLKTLIELSTANTLILLSCRIRYDRDTNFLAKLEKYFTVTKILYDKQVDVNLFKAIKR